MIVLAAAAYLARRTWRSWTGRATGGCGGCRCAKAPAATGDEARLIRAEEITIRRR
jgi:hypothetical protein